MLPVAEQVKSSFRKWDAEGRGVILKDELAYVLRFLDPQTTDGELDALFSAAQINHEDSISYERFVTWLFCEVPDVFGRLCVADFNEASQSKCLWEVAMTSAIDEASRHCPKAKVDAYFADVRARVTDAEFSDRARQRFLDQFSKAEHACYEEVERLVSEVVQCSVDLVSARPSPSEVRVAFDAQDAKAGSRGYLDLDEFVDLARSLQVHIALRTLLVVEGRAAQNVKQLQSNTALREKGLWQDAMAISKAKACQRYSQTAVETYFDGVNARLSSPAYAEHVTGAFFAQVDIDKDGKVSFDEATGLIYSTLQCAADLGGAQRPTSDVIRSIFDAHDTIEMGWNFMGGNEFLNLMRYLQVQVAEAMLPLSEVVKHR